MGLCQCEIKKDVSETYAMTWMVFWKSLWIRSLVVFHTDVGSCMRFPLSSMSITMVPSPSLCISFVTSVLVSGKIVFLCLLGGSAQVKQAMETRLICSSWVSGTLHTCSAIFVFVFWTVKDLSPLAPSWACSLAAFQDFCLKHDCRCPEPWVLHKLLLFHRIWKHHVSDSLKKAV